MKALGVFPSKREIRIVDHPEPKLAAADEVKLRVLEAGVCGTDREICDFQFGEAPPGSDYFVLGHEAIGEVAEAGGQSGFMPGELVVPMVRLPCPEAGCVPCRNGRQDHCGTDSFPEHGIRRAHGFLTDFVVERAKFLFKLPPALRDVGVLVEPLTIAEKALLQVDVVRGRMPFETPGRTAAVLGAGPVGLLGAMALVSRGWRTFVLARSPETTPNAALAKSIGAEYLSVPQGAGEEVARRIGPIDLVYEAAGSVHAAFKFLEVLGPNGIFVFTGVPGLKSPMSIDAEKIMRHMVLRNQVAMGTVNAGRDAFEAAIADLAAFSARWPAALRGLVTGRYPLESWRSLLIDKPTGIKSVVAISP
jgi:threonine dehydrogenase-like Zn-dependent dehydrogenase